MYKTISDFVSDYRAESQKTLATLEAISDGLLDKKVDPKGMTLAELALHIIQAIEKITSQIGFQYSSSVLGIEVPNSTRELLIHYNRISNSLIEVVSSKEDSFLDRSFAVYSSRWSAAQTLSVLVKHEIHHRAQLILALRILGQKVPDIYGPARKE